MAAIAPFQNTYRAHIDGDTLVWLPPAFPAERPMQLLVTALVQCSVLTIDSIVRKQRRLVTHYTIAVHAQQRAALPQIWESISLDIACSGANLDDALLSRALTLAPHYCPVHVMLAHTAAIHETIRHTGEST